MVKISQLPSEFTYNPEDSLTSVWIPVEDSSGDSKRLELKRITNQYVLVASGIGSVDQPRFEAACAANDKVIIDDTYAMLRLDQGGDISCGDTRVQGLNGKAHIKLENNTRLLVGNYLSPGASNSWESATVSADNTLITAATLSGVQEGDVLVVTADDNITGVEPHLTTQKPAELVAVTKVDGSDYEIHTQLVDSYTTNVKVYHLPKDGSVGTGMSVAMSIHAALVDLDIDGPNVGESTAVIFRCCYRPLVQNVSLHNVGQLFLTTCLFARVDNLEIDGQQDAHLDYGLSISCCDESLITNFRSKRCRHHFTTSAFTDESDVNTRVGTNRRNRLNGFWVWSSGPDTGDADGNLGIDCHPEGYETIIENGVCDMSGTISDVTTGIGPTTAGVNNRARKTLIKSVVFLGGSNGKTKETGGIKTSADDVTVLDCEFYDLWYGIRKEPTTGGQAPDRLTVAKCFARRIRNDAVILDGGDGDVIEDNDFDECGESGSGLWNSYGETIGIGDHFSGSPPTNLTIRNNRLPKSNGYSINWGTSAFDPDELTCYGNRLDGYNRCEMGFDRSLAGVAKLERRLATQNNRLDDGYYTRTAHGLSTADEGKAIGLSGAIWDNVEPFLGILLDVIDVDTIVVAQPGRNVVIPYSMVNGVASYDPGSDGYRLRWDSTAEGFSVTGDGGGEPYVLQTADYDATGLNAKVLV